MSNYLCERVRRTCGRDTDAFRTLTLTIDGAGADVHNIIFGNALDNTLTGGDKFDHLYGGSGNDALFGGKDNDRLEGQLGEDILYGEAGRDVLIGANGLLGRIKREAANDASFAPQLHYGRRVA